MFEHKIDLQEEYFEHLWVNIIINKKKFPVNCLCRPPNHSPEDHNIFLTTAQTVLQKLQNFQVDYKTITSDLNYGNNYCKESLIPPKPLDIAAPDLFAKYGFQQLIDIPTCITKDRYTAYKKKE